jgi:hypothetical protein
MNHKQSKYISQSEIDDKTVDKMIDLIDSLITVPTKSKSVPKMTKLPDTEDSIKPVRINNKYEVVNSVKNNQHEVMEQVNNEYIESYGDNAIVNDEKSEPIVDDYDDVKIVTKELGKKLIVDMKNNFADTKQYIKQNQYDIIVDMINYLIIVIDFLNKLIYDAFQFIQTKILGQENNFYSHIKQYFDIISNYFIAKITKNTIEKMKSGKSKHWKK